MKLYYKKKMILNFLINLPQVMEKTVLTLLKKAETVEDKVALGIRALESTIEAIEQEIKVKNLTVQSSTDMLLTLVLFINQKHKTLYQSTTTCT